ncbi:MAG: carboxypeptidase-like regulatory domain-containing protein [Bacteroidaceae bacterium]|nr:carboxypeptidase-like regulatory domain-containing protein [Bacteroidaceae bacterium]MBQ5776117.1 carboxypeptidase-like regulatory domain-containing protein [Bacteroidaceae bacterium]
MTIHYRLILIISLLFVSIRLFSQEVVKLSGAVIDADNQPVELALVRIAGTTTGTTTNLEGKYELKINSADSVLVVFSCLGYKNEEHLLKNPKGNVKLNVQLQKKSIDLNEVVVTEFQKQQGTMQKIKASDMQLMPNTSGGIEGMLATFAGVNSNNELSSQYSVRGGNFDENIVYINGIEIYRPLLVRSGQQEGMSVINPDLVSSISFSSGGFSAEYGDKMSSVLDIQYKRPEALEVSLSGSFLGATASVGHSTGKFTQLHGVRYHTNSTLLSSLDVKGEYNPSYFDYQTYMTYKFSDKFEVALLGNIAINNYQFTPFERTTSFGTAYDTKSFTVYFDGMERDVFETYFGSVSANYRPNKENELSLQVSAFSSNEYVSYDISGQYWLDELAGSDNTSENAPAKGDLGVGTYHEHARNRLKATVMSVSLKGAHRIVGNDIRWGVTYNREQIYDYLREWEMRDSVGYTLPYVGDDIHMIYNIVSENRLESNRISAYLQDTYRLRTDFGLFNFNAGVRLSYWDFNNECIVSPRASITFIPEMNSNFTFRLAGGVYYQAPFYKEFRDTVSTGGNNFIVRLNDRIKSQQSIQVVAGGDYTFRAFDRPFKVSLEAYYKKLNDLIPYEANNVKLWYSAQNESEGYAAGLDFKLYGEFVPGTDSWLSFSLMRTEEKINEVWVPRPTDQRYSVGIFFQDYVPKLPMFKISLKGIISDGLTFGAPMKGRAEGYYRAPAYKRVDMGLTYIIIGGEEQWSKYGFWRNIKSATIGVDVFNLFDFANVNSYTWVTDVNNVQYAVPNYLTRRQLNVRLAVKF